MLHLDIFVMLGRLSPSDKSVRMCVRKREMWEQRRGGLLKRQAAWESLSCVKSLLSSLSHQPHTSVVLWRWYTRFHRLLYGAFTGERRRGGDVPKQVSGKGWGTDQRGKEVWKWQAQVANGHLGGIIHDGYQLVRHQTSQAQETLFNLRASVTQMSMFMMNDHIWLNCEHTDRRKY